MLLISAALLSSSWAQAKRSRVASSWLERQAVRKLISRSFSVAPCLFRARRKIASDVRDTRTQSLRDVPWGSSFNVNDVDEEGLLRTSSKDWFYLSRQFLATNTYPLFDVRFLKEVFQVVNDWEGSDQIRFKQRKNASKELEENNNKNARLCYCFLGSDMPW